MRISDCSSDVCSSDLVHLPNQPVAVDLAVRHVERTHHAREGAVETVPGTDDGQHAVLVAHRGLRHAIIGAVHCCHSTSPLRNRQSANVPISTGRPTASSCGFTSFASPTTTQITRAGPLA